MTNNRIGSQIAKQYGLYLAKSRPDRFTTSGHRIAKQFLRESLFAKQLTGSAQGRPE